MLPQLVELLQQALSGARTARRLLAFLEPGLDAAAMVEPLLAVASVLLLAVLTGMAIGSLSTLLVLLAALYVLVTEVFGLSLEVAFA